MKTLQALPLRYWPLDQADLKDYSGYAVNATASGTEGLGVGLTNQIKFSQRLSSTRTITYSAPVMRNNNKKQSYSIGATFFPLDENPVKIFSRSNATDGLYWDGKSIQFTTQYTTSGESRCSYTPPNFEKFDVLGVHTPSKNILYVNGALVAESNIAINQQRDTYLSESPSFISGGGKALINAVYVVGGIVKTDLIKSIYDYNNRRHEGEVSAAFGGEAYNLDYILRNPYLVFEFDTDAEWGLGTFSNANIQNSALKATLVDGLTNSGTWTYTFDLSRAGDPVNVDCVNMDWSGKNIEVHTSYDGGDWVLASKRTNVASITPGYLVDSTKIFQVRITLLPGQLESYVNTLTIRAYSGATVTPSVARPITFTKIVNGARFQPMKLSTAWGATGKDADSSVAFGPDPSVPVINPLTIEVWMRKRGTVTTSFSPSTIYINSIANGTADVGEWALYHYILPSAATTFSFTGQFDIGKVAIYPTALSQTSITSIYNDYTGTNATIFVASESIVLSESDPTPLTYAADWSISAV